MRRDAFSLMQDPSRLAKLEEPAKGDAHQVSLKHLVELEKLGSGAFSVVSPLLILQIGEFSVPVAIFEARTTAVVDGCERFRLHAEERSVLMDVVVQLGSAHLNSTHKRAFETDASR
jgi:hypothetical protein